MLSNAMQCQKSNPYYTKKWPNPLDIPVFFIPLHPISLL